jgi:hypothetical protein
LCLANRIHFHRQDGSRAAANSGAPACLIAFGAHNVERLRTSGIEGYLLTNWEAQFPAIKSALKWEFMGRHTGEELEIIALIERMQDRRLTAAEAAIALAQAYAIGELSEPPDNMPAWDVVAPRRQAGCAEEAAAGLPPQ